MTSRTRAACQKGWLVGDCWTSGARATSGCWALGRDGGGKDERGRVVAGEPQLGVPSAAGELLVVQWSWKNGRRILVHDNGGCLIRHDCGGESIRPRKGKVIGTVGVVLV